MNLSVNSQSTNPNFTSAFKLERRLTKVETKAFMDEFITAEEDCVYRYIVPKKKQGIRTIISIKDSNDSIIEKFLEKNRVEFKKLASTRDFLIDFYKINQKLKKKHKKQINGIDSELPKCSLDYGIKKCKEWANCAISNVLVPTTTCAYKSK